ncbi:Putative Zinc finger, CCHC-type [Septoria linicola]|uniref:Zinc finger, CCHC-type n=1 Tax=Septoria linicola TaxID=215465 RepID=A0A9Q9ARA6_9PEZI|nr:putative Zinc finger, CCHC-type [Septoria linicola]USW50743.1 Putative Zinc finger, CCHC-type [Septoria linicola]
MTQDMSNSSRFRCSTCQITKAWEYCRLEAEEVLHEDRLICYTCYDTSPSRKRKRADDAHDGQHPAKRQTASAAQRVCYPDFYRPRYALDHTRIKARREPGSRGLEDQSLHWRDVETEWQSSRKTHGEVSRSHSTEPERSPQLLRDLEYFPHDTDADPKRIERCFPKVLAKEEALHGKLANSSHLIKGYGPLHDLDFSISDCAGTLDRFVNIFLPTLRSQSILHRDPGSWSWVRDFLESNSEHAAQRATVEWKLSQKNFAKQLEAHCTLIFAEAVRHQFRHLITDGSACKRLLRAEGCPSGAARNGDLRSKSTKSDLEWDTERIFVYARAVELVKAHVFWDRACRKLLDFCNEQGLKFADNESSSIDAVVDALAQLQKDHKPSNDTEKLLAEMAILQRQFQPVQLRSVIEKLCSNTTVPGSAKPTRTAKWKQWVRNEVLTLRELHEKQEKPKSHPFNELLDSGEFQGPDELIEVLLPLYADLSKTIHNIFETGIGGPVDERRAKILEALTPQSIRTAGKTAARSHVDPHAEMARYLTAISGCRPAIDQHATNVSTSSTVENKPQRSTRRSSLQHRLAGAHSNRSKERETSHHPTCFRCGREGHLAHECRSWKQQRGDRKAGRCKPTARRGC